jgi:tetratricopeptide (TPR) repeat protein
LAIDPEDIDALNNKALALDNIGNYAEAIKYYDKVLAIIPNSVDALNNKGNALGKLGKYIEATKYYRKAIEILKSNHSNQSANYSQTASVVGIGGATTYRYIVANPDLLNSQYVQIAATQNTVRDPKLIIVQINYAKTLVNIGQYQLAIVTYKEILQIDPYNGCALFGKAQALDKLGQHAEAVKDYEIAKKLSPACGTDLINIQRKDAQPSQIGALAEGFSLLFSHR